MTSTAVDVEQSSLNQRSANAQVSLDDHHEKTGFVGEESRSEENPGNAWGPQDA